MLSFHAAVHAHLSHPPVGYQLIVGVRLFAWELRLEAGPGYVRRWSEGPDKPLKGIRRPFLEASLLNHGHASPFCRWTGKKYLFKPTPGATR